MHRAGERKRGDRNRKPGFGQQVLQEVQLDQPEQAGTEPQYEPESADEQAGKLDLDQQLPCAVKISRVVGDALWPPETPLASVVDYFPAPLLALRTLKSDPVVGLPAGLAARLDGVDPDWRINGKRGVIELAM